MSFLGVNTQLPSPPHNVADWLSPTHRRSAHFIAEKTCEMVCYLWFSSSLAPSTRKRLSPSSFTSSSRSPPLSNQKTAALQFSASPAFIHFMQKLLETTQVSQSVIVLSLHYIFRLKERNEFSLGRSGSEFRVAVVALMLANKFVDDNTYTNKTWSDVSGIALSELNKMEREFLMGIDFRLFVDEPTYESWLNLLRGLVLAKERECQKWLLSRAMGYGYGCSTCYGSRKHNSRHHHHLPPPLTHHLPSPSKRGRSSNRPVETVAETPTKVNALLSPSAPTRARSSSPARRSVYTYAPSAPSYPFTFAIPHSQSTSSEHPSQAPSHSLLRPSFKRTANDAFSPASATFSSIPTKRPTGLALDIAAATNLTASASTNANANGNLSANGHFAESLKGFERMSLNCNAGNSGSNTPVDAQPLSHLHHHPHTLAAPYKPEDSSRRALPQNLYFYTLASSPMRDGSAYVSEGRRVRNEGMAKVSGDVEVASVRGDDEVEEGDSDTEERMVIDDGLEDVVGAAPEDPRRARKARLKYSKPPINAGDAYSASDAFGYGYGLYGNYGGYNGNNYYGQGQQRQLATPTSTSNSTPQSISQPPSSVVQHSQSQTHLPPLKLALALTPSSSTSSSSSNGSTELNFPDRRLDRTLPPPFSHHSNFHNAPYSNYHHLPHRLPLVAHSARTSPVLLPSFADTYGVYAHPQSSSSYFPPHQQPGQNGKRGEAVNELTSQSQSHLHSSSHGHHYSHTQHQHQQSHHPPSSFRPNVPSPLAQHEQQQQSHQEKERERVSPGQDRRQPQSQVLHVPLTPPPSSLTPPVAPGSFANAGPPGVHHFYTPETRFRARAVTASVEAAVAAQAAVANQASAFSANAANSQTVGDVFGSGGTNGYGSSATSSPDSDTDVDVYSSPTPPHHHLSQNNSFPRHYSQQHQQRCASSYVNGSIHGHSEDHGHVLSPSPGSQDSACAQIHRHFQPRPPYSYSVNSSPLAHTYAARERCY